MLPRALVRAFLFGALGASAWGCPGGLDDPGEFLGDDAGAATAAGGIDGSTFMQDARASNDATDGSLPSCGDVPALLGAHCASAGCHGQTPPAAALDLASAGLSARIVDKPASGGGLLADPANPSASVLYTKLLASPPFGSRMPLAAPPLGASDTACVLSWLAGLQSVGADAAGIPDADHPGNPVDAGDGWTPNSSAKTVLWLDAREGVTVTAGMVSAWADRSSSANHAAPSDTATAPTLDPVGIQGAPAIRFEAARGTYLSIGDAASLQWGTGGFVIAIVGQSSRATAGLGHGGGVSTVFAKPQLQSAVEITVHWNYFTTENADDDTTFNAQEGEGEPGVVSTVDGYSDGTPRLYVARVDTSSGAASIELRVNGVTVGASTGNPLVDVSLPGSPVRIGSTYGQSVQGAIAEVVALRGNVSDADIAKLEGYLMSKHGLNAGGHP